MSKPKNHSDQRDVPTLRVVPDPPSHSESDQPVTRVQHVSPLLNFDLHPTDAPPVRFCGRKLLSMSSRQVRHIEIHQRWYDLTLYKGEGSDYYLEIAYQSQTVSEHEKESPRLDVIQGPGLALVAESLARFDFMRPVNLDYYGGGHCSMMEFAEWLHFELVTTFSLTVSRFLQTIARNRMAWDCRF